MSLRTVERVLKLFRDHGDVTVPKLGLRPARRGLIQGVEWNYLEGLIHDDPSMFLAEMQEILYNRFGTKYAVSTICQTLLRHDYTFKKLHLMSIRRDREEEEAWTVAMAEFPASWFLFADETRKDPKSLYRRHGRGLRGCRVPAYQELARGTSYSALGLLNINGMVDYSISQAKGGE